MAEVKSRLTVAFALHALNHDRIGGLFHHVRKVEAQYRGGDDGDDDFDDEDGKQRRR